ncbi:MAG: DNA-processing protein DprA [Alphaproteobacteria bacterium]|nr:DNA-processing protein DprA [Alphaproteobacteria bacterium]
MTRKNLDPKEKLAWLQLSRTENIGPITFYKLLERYGSAANALKAIPDLARRGGRLGGLKAFAADLAEKEIEQVEKYGARLIARDEPDYPALLAELEDAPPLIAVLGNAALLPKPSLGVVGARNASLAGRRIAEDFSSKVAAAGYVIVSGLARGIDTAAHTASLSTGTIAVVAGGIDIVYPRENEKLYRQIAEQGAIIAESPFGTEPQARHFPRRNRLVSGLSLGVLIVEAALKSGSLITARMAAEQNREVFAVPGSPLDPRAEGTNKLIQDGAHLALSADDIIHELRSLRLKPLHDQADGPWQSPPRPIGGTADQAPDESLRMRIMEMLNSTPVQIDEVIRAAGAPVSDVLIVILELEIAGCIERQPGNKINLM